MIGAREQSMAFILLVDDDDQFREMVRAMLERLGHAVVPARNGNEALARCAQVLPDLVITDLIMPDKEGLQTIRELRKFARGLPITSQSMMTTGRTGPGGGSRSYSTASRNSPAAGAARAAGVAERSAFGSRKRAASEGFRS